MIKQNDKVRMRKIDTAESPEFKTPSWDEYTPGDHHPSSSVPVKYEVKGWIELIKENYPIVLDTFERNGEKVEGITKTSPVQNIKIGEGGEVVFAETFNSIYLIEKI